MIRIRSRGEALRSYVIENVEEHPRTIAKLTAEHFGISRQAANKQLQNLVKERALVMEGNTRRRVYKLCPLAQTSKVYPLTSQLAEDIVWRDDIAPALGELPGNVLDIWHHGFTEMFNNAIDHSGGTTVMVQLSKTATTTEIIVVDDGIGIFRKIQAALGLVDERHAVLELAKGKLTTDPARHSGEGIFFSSRMFDRFVISSGATHFSHEFGEDTDWIQEVTGGDHGTGVIMRLKNHTARTTRKVFRQFSSGDDYAFTKTIVPVRLAQYGEDKLISRSQAKRLLERVDRFKTVLLDFDQVTSIGQAFTDEIFRVFQRQHPEIELIPINASTDVQQMITRTRMADFNPPG